MVYTASAQYTITQREGNKIVASIVLKSPLTDSNMLSFELEAIHALHTRLSQDVRLLEAKISQEAKNV